MQAYKLGKKPHTMYLLPLKTPVRLVLTENTTFVKTTFVLSSALAVRAELVKFWNLMPLNSIVNISYPGTTESSTRTWSVPPKNSQVNAAASVVPHRKMENSNNGVRGPCDGSKMVPGQMLKI
jgi:hypothetical protein